MPAIRRRIEGLEAHAGGLRLAPGWAPEEIAEKALDEIDFALATRSPVELCPAELEALGVGGISDLPERLQPHVQLCPSDWGPIRHRYKEPPQVPFEGWREKVRKHREGVEALRQESRQRDRELLEDNRAACGLPPLTPQQITEWDLEGTTWGEG